MRFTQGHKIIVSLLIAMILPTITFGAFRHLTVPQGGSGTGNLSGWLYGNGTNPFTASSTPFFSDAYFANLSVGETATTTTLCFDDNTCMTSANNSQTPWVSDIDGGGYNLTNVGNASTTQLSAVDYFGIKDEMVDVDTLSGATYTTVEDWWNITQSAGKINSGGQLSDNGDGTITISEGYGLFKTTNSSIGDNVSGNLPVNSSFGISLNEINYIYADYDTLGFASTTVRADINGRNKVAIGIAYNDGTHIHTLSGGVQVQDLAQRTHKKAEEKYGFERVSGMVISETGTRGLAMTSGQFWRGNTEFSATASSTITFSTWYNDGAWQETTEQTTVSNTQYNDYGTGLETIAPNKYGVYYIYRDFDEHFHLVYGVGSYNLATAQGLGTPDNLPDVVKVFSMLLAKVIVERNGTNFTGIQTPWDTQFSGQTVTDHGSLGGLLDDDHTQYLLVNGTRALSGAWDMGSQNISNLTAIGTSTMENLDISGDLNVDGNIYGSFSFVTSGDLQVDNIKLSGNTIEATNDSGLYLYDNASNGIFVKDGGNIGIGTTAPGAGLEVSKPYNEIGAIITGGAPGYSSALIVQTATGGERFRITGDGNIGIGTTAPTRQLEISNTADAIMRLHSDTDANDVTSDAMIEFYIDAGTAKGNIGYNRGENAFVMGYGAIDTSQLSISSTGDVTIANELTVSGTGDTTIAGNVGIGTTAPSQPLHVEFTNTDGGISGWFLKNKGTDAANSYAGLRIQAQNSVVDGSFDIVPESGSIMGGGGALFRTITSHQIGFSTGNTIRMRLSAAGGLSLGSTYQSTDAGSGNMIIQGNVGIGTTAPTKALDVNGDAKVNNLLWFNPSSGLAALGVSGTDINFYNGAGAETRMTITSNGNVGIGTTAPNEKLHVVESDVAVTPQVDSVAVFEKNDNMAINLLTANNKYSSIFFGDGDAASTGRIRYYHSNDELDFWTNNTQAMLIDSSGNVGIGTTAPSRKLQIEDASAPKLGITYTGQREYSLGVTGGGTDDGLAIIDESGANEIARFTRAGNVGIGTTAPIKLLHLNSASDPTLLITDSNYGSTASDGFRIQQSNVDSYLINQETGDMYFGVDNSLDMTISTSGNIGIGTTTPASKLDVNGIIKTQPASSRTCDALAEGGIMYDSDDNHFYGCNGSSWVQLDN